MGSTGILNKSSDLNDYEDYSTPWHATYANEGIITGGVVTETAIQSLNASITAGSVAISTGGNRLNIFSFDAQTLTGIDTTAGINNLVVAKVTYVDAASDSATFTVEVVQGGSGTDPALTEGGGATGYYLVLARIVGNGGNVVNADIEQAGTTNNGDSEIIYRQASIRESIAVRPSDWNAFGANCTYLAWDSTHKDAVFALDTDVTATVKVGHRIRFTQTTDGEKFGFVHYIDETEMVVFLGTSFDFDNEAITNVEYSSMYIPSDFPTEGNIWEVRLNTVGSVVGPVASQTYDLYTSSFKKGIRELMYEVSLSTDDTSPDTTPQVNTIALRIYNSTALSVLAGKTYGFSFGTWSAGTRILYRDDFPITVSPYLTANSTIKVQAVTPSGTNDFGEGINLTGELIYRSKFL